VDVRAILERVDACMLADQRRLRQRVRSLGPGPPKEPLERLREEIERSVARREDRWKNRPKIEYPAELPVSAARGEIARAILDHQVVVVCGETGSGKTTQLPKLCLELGGGIAGQIGHTQPRRIAARSVASRIAEELHGPLGRAVGYKVRFGDQASPDNYIKVMTDGILLAETQRDRLLEQYDTIIIDEAHERSLNIDFLLGYLKLILPQRPDLKVIVTSATIDPERFAAHFSTARQRVPVLMVSGRTYPVEVLWRPREVRVGEDGLRDEADDLPTAVVRAVDEAAGLGQGDMLVFLPGEREIRECAEALRKHHVPGRERTAVLPLYARLSAEEQNKVFEPHRDRRVVLTTNVAETSLTVPGVRYVIDAGEARLNRYSPRTKVQRLEVESISRASADQRRGRCGRLAPGVCIRLYSEEDYKSRAEFTDPEIIRTNLASVILQMKALGLGRVENFPFVEAPDSRLVKDGYETLRELGAVDDAWEITELGKRLAKLPIDPRIGRMILAADTEGSLREVLVIAAALSVQDPRDRRLDVQQAADAAHAKFRDENSDFLAFLKLWRAYREAEATLSRSRLVKWCRENYLSFFRMREWEEVWRQLRELLTEMGHRENPKDAPADAVHRAVLAGLLISIGRKGEQGEYNGTHGTKFNIFPGSGVYRAKPKWVVASEIVRTTKVYARCVAKIEPEWIERLSMHLVKRSYTDPHWDGEGQRVTAVEQVTLFGLEISGNRRVHFGPVDPVRSRELFIHHGLVLGELDTHGKFLRRNLALQDEVEKLEEKSRKRDVLVDQQQRYVFYDTKIPQGVYSRDTFEAWRRDAEKDNSGLLEMTREDLMLHGADHVTPQHFPDSVGIAGSRLRLEYALTPGETHDGVTMNVPLEALNQVDARKAEWLVPGLLAEKIEAMIRAIPKSARRHIGPPAEAAREIARELPFGEGDLRERIAKALESKTHVEMPRAIWDAIDIPPHLRMNFRVVDDKGRELAHGRDIDDLRRRLGARVEESFSKVGGERFHRDHVTSWDFGELPERVEVRRNGMTVVAFPGIVDQGADAALRVLETPERAREATRHGLRRLFLLKAGKEIRHRLLARSAFQKMATQYATIGPPEDFRNDLLGLIAERAFMTGRPTPRSAESFSQEVERGWDRIPAATDEVAALAGAILEGYQSVRLQLDSVNIPAFARAHADVQDQLRHLLPRGFLVSTPGEWLPHFPRFLSAAWHRLDRLRGHGPARDELLTQGVAPFWNAAKARVELHRAAGVTDPELSLYRWMVEELRVSVYAQELRTSISVSPKKLQQQWDKIGKP
jgi:ATP-dependent helicase HrpA